MVQLRHSMALRLVAVLAVALSGRSLLAEAVSPESAAKVARAWLAREGRRCPEVRGTSRFAATNSATYYAVKMRGGGTVITTGDTEHEPVILISGESIDFATLDSRSPLLDLLNGDASARGLASSAADRTPQLAQASKAALAQRLHLSQAAAHKRRWAELLREGDASDAGTTLTLALAGSESWIVDPYTVASGLSDIRVSPLCKTKWSQSTAQGKSVYNYYTPNGTDPAAFTADATTNVVCGCVATAMSQVMRYFAWPKESVTPVTHTCSWFETEMDLTMQGGVYDWENMPLVPSSGSLTDEERRAIGKLTSDVGISVYMGYNLPNSKGNPSGESGAYSFDVGVALRDVFGYADAAWFYDEYGLIDGETDPDQFSDVRDEALQRALYSNLDAGLPAIMGLSGHEVVADGYGYSSEGLDYVHINMGWAGSDDYWYCLPTVQYSSGGIMYFNDLTYNVFTNVAEKSAVASGRVLDTNGAPVSGATVRFYQKQGRALQTVVTSSESGVYGAVVPVGAYVVEAEKNGLTNEVTVTVSAPVTSDVFWNSLRTIPTVYTSTTSDLGNSWGNDLTLGAEPVYVPDTLYVDAASGADDNDGLSEATAKRTIQAAVDAAEDGATVVVLPGGYEPFVTADRPLTIQSEQGAYETWIDGGGTNRCATMGSAAIHTNVALIGFCLQNGSAANGGGASGGRLYRCYVIGNEASASGGGLYNSQAFDCEISYNRAATCGGGTYCGKLVNCTVAANEVDEDGAGGGTIYGTEINCIVWDNWAGEETNNYEGGIYSHCLTWPAKGGDNICADPRFFDSEAGDFALRYDSPCLDAGDNDAVVDELDVYGWPRIVNGTVDIGAYEGFILDAPQDVTASDGTSSAAVTISWSPVEGATSYVIVRASSDDLSAAYGLVRTTATTYDDARCWSWTTYWYWVYALADGGAAYISESDSGYRYQANTYALSYDANGGVGTMAGEIRSTVSAKALKACSFTKSGCVFMGWSTVPTGSRQYRDRQSVCVSTTAGDIVTLYAIWAPYDADGFVITDRILQGWAGTGSTDLVVPEGVTNVADYAFERSSVTSVEFPASLASLGASVFVNCSALTNVVFAGNAPEVGADAFAGVDAGCIVWAERSSTGWNVDIPGTWQGVAIRYVPYYSYPTCAETLSVSSTAEGVTVAAKDDAVLTQADLDSVKISAILSDGTEADTTAGYRAVLSDDGKSATFVLKEPTVGTAVEDGAPAAADDPSGQLVEVAEDEIAAKPVAQSGESVGALPVKTVRGLWYQASWGDDLGGLTTGEKVQATGASLYLGVIRQTGTRGFYRIAVSAY